MTLVHLTVDVGADRKVILELPPEVPVGKAKITVSIESEPSGRPPKRPRSSLADWADQNAEDYGGKIRSDDVEGFTGRKF
jgi:hypothetical protein